VCVCVCVCVWTGFIWLRTGTMAGSCEHCSEPSGSIKGDDEFLDKLSDS
jgi:hypothetical protein